MIDARVLVVGVGGLGCPAAIVLARSGVRSLTLLDDDVVDVSNLQRQVLYSDEQVGMRKVDAAAESLRRMNPRVSVERVDDRLVPENAVDLVRDHDLVVEGADNFATKFMAFDAARLAHRPIVQAGSVRWTGWSLASPTSGGPCLRCVFEDLPKDRADTCAESGVVGPVVGVLGAMAASLALRVALGDSDAFGNLVHYDALAGRLRRVRVAQRSSCPSCLGEINDLSRERYAPSCAA